MTNPLVDPHGRVMRKLRVQLTDVCNFRCFYCMPKNVRFQPSETLLPPEDLIRMVAGLVRLGINEIRLTGGEPLARNEFPQFVEGIGKLPLLKFGLTTNGYWLAEYLPLLKEHGCMHINVSLDSLQADRFNEITFSQHYEKVLAAILQAKEMGFPVKINAVLLRGRNDDEVEAFAEFSARHKIPVRFLEYMKIGPSRDQFQQVFISAGEVIKRLKQSMKLTPLRGEADATAFSFRTESGGELGFIASESQPFCANCSRLRISARGLLRACLMSEAGISMVGVPESEYSALLQRVLPMKPFSRLPEIAQPMHQIGG